MKRRKDNVDEFLLRHLGLFKTPPKQEMDAAEARIEKGLRTATATAAADFRTVDLVSTRRGGRVMRLAFALATVAAAIALVLVWKLPREVDAHVVLASPDGSLSRVSGDKTESVRSGERIEPGATLRTNDATAAINLADGSRVELRPQAEFSVERATDGVRIVLYRGGLVVHAAKQLTGYLHVQTKDVVVSVVGTVFFVNAEEEGSRVAVLEGEVRVKQGATTKNLLPGDQFATNPEMAPLPAVTPELFRQPETVVLATLTEPAAPAAQAPQAPRPAFDVISIRPSVALPGRGGRGVAPGAPAPASLPPAIAEAQARNRVCAGPGSQPDVTPGRFVIRSTVYRLIVLAYGLKDCPLALELGLISGGPDWIRTDHFDVQATIPQGSPAYTRQQLSNGEAPELQLMIQELLAVRLKLMIRRETKDLPAFNLVVARPGRIKLSEDQTPPAPVAPGTPMSTSALPRGTMLNCTGNALLISSVAKCLQRSAGGTIVDRTELKGLYDVPPLASPDPTVPVDQATYVLQVLEQIGLRLERTKAPGEVLTVERVERPGEN